MDGDNIAHVEIQAIKASIEKIEKTLEKLLDREQDRASRINEIEKVFAIFESDCRACRGERKAEIDQVHNKIREMNPLNGVKAFSMVIGALLSLSALIGIVFAVIMKFHEAGIIK